MFLTVEVGGTAKRTLLAGTSIDSSTADRAGEARLVWRTDAATIPDHADSIVVKGKPYNLAPQSETLDASPWTTPTGAITADATTAPDGNTTAEKMRSVSEAADLRWIGNATTLDDDAIYTFSVHAKAAELDWFSLRIRSQDNVFRSAWFNAAAGTVGTVGTGVLGHGMEHLGAGWFRCWLVFNSASGAFFPIFDLFPTSGDNTLSLSGVADNDGVYFWGAQLVTGAEPGDYLKTTTNTEETLFDGDIVSLSMREELPDQILVTAECVDQSGRFRTSWVPLTTYTAQSDRAIIKDLVNSNHDPNLPNITAADAEVDIIVSSIDVTFDKITLQEALGKIQSITQGVLFVAPDGKVHHNTEANADAAAYNVSDAPDGSTTFAYEDFDYQIRWEERANVVEVKGGLDPVSGQRLGAAASDTISQTTYGAMRLVIKDDSLDNQQATVDLANNKLAQLKDPKKQGRFRVRRDGLKVNTKIQVTSASFNLSAETFVIKRISMQQQGGGRSIYDVEIGQIEANMAAALKDATRPTAVPSSDPVRIGLESRGPVRVDTAAGNNRAIMQVDGSDRGVLDLKAGVDGLRRARLGMDNLGSEEVGLLELSDDGAVRVRIRAASGTNETIQLRNDDDTDWRAEMNLSAAGNHGQLAVKDANGTTLTLRPNDATDTGEEGLYRNSKIILAHDVLTIFTSADAERAKLHIDGNDHGVLEVMDNTGTTRARVEVDASDHGRIALLDNNGTEVLVLGVDAGDDGLIEVKDQAGITHVTIDNTGINLGTAANLRANGTEILNAGTRNITNANDVNAQGEYKMDGTTLINTSKQMVGVGNVTLTAGAVLNTDHVTVGQDASGHGEILIDNSAGSMRIRHFVENANNWGESTWRNTTSEDVVIIRGKETDGGDAIRIRKDNIDRVKLGIVATNDGSVSCLTGGGAGHSSAQLRAGLDGTEAGLTVASNRVVGPQEAAISNPASTTGDNNTAIIAILDAMRNHGLIAT